ncbi:MAG: TIGR02147 family protein [Elusimicrobiota bacterium]
MLVNNKDKEMKDIFEYTDFRTYLKDYYLHKKETTLYFSFRYFSKKAGFASPSVLKFIIDGKRNLSQEGINKFIDALGLTQKRSAYFQGLVNFNQAKTEKAKNRYFNELIKLTPGTQFKHVEKNQYEFYSKWYYSAIRELVTIKDFNDDPAWIAEHLHPPISLREAKNAVSTLLKLGFIKRNKDGKLIQAAPLITTGNEISSLSIRNFHRQMIGLAGESLESVQNKRREISSLTMGISEKSFMEIKERIAAFEDEILETISKDTEKTEHVYQLNFQFFPLNSNRAKVK